MWTSGNLQAGVVGYNHTQGMHVYVFNTPLSLNVSTFYSWIALSIIVANNLNISTTRRFRSCTSYIFQRVTLFRTLLGGKFEGTYYFFTK